MPHKNSCNDCDLRIADSPHFSGMAKCHSVSFPGRFMTEMGQKWLSALYAFFINHVDGISYVAMDASRTVIGFVVGGNKNIRPQFLQYALIRYPHIILWKFLCKSMVRKTLLAELAKKLHRKEKKARAGLSNREDPKECGSLLSICVMPEYQGSGIAGELIEAFQSACAEEGYDRLELSVVSENERAIKFYKKHGWSRIECRGQSERFMLVLNRDTNHSAK